MSNKTSIPEPQFAVLMWQVIETNRFGSLWIVAAFNGEFEARRWADEQNRLERDAEIVHYHQRSWAVREDPEWAAIRAMGPVSA